MSSIHPAVERAIEVHGGRERWAAVRALKLTWSFRGMMFKLRLREAQLHRLSARIDTHAPRVEVEPFPAQGQRGIFEGSAVALEGGPAAQRLENPRATFGLRSLAWWTDFEMLYFAGYVLWNYSQLPFLLLQPGLTFEDQGTSSQQGETWAKVGVRFPDGFPTHSPEQSFYFGPDGRLRRHDYYVGIMSKLARGARFIHAYQEVEGLLLPSRIEMKLGTVGESYSPWPSLGFVDLDDVSLER